MRPRFIPVYIGNTNWEVPVTTTCPVYPCVYREHVVVGRISADDVRFIPVYTGNTPLTKISPFIKAVYPCVYREHRYSVTCISSIIGLSLCIQGTQPLIVWFQQHMRFIPVYTGNTHSTKITSNIWSVYPCVYREHRINNDFHRIATGLSLCIQGTL